jgi:hypothetical protein
LLQNVRDDESIQHEGFALAARRLRQLDRMKQGAWKFDLTKAGRQVCRWINHPPDGGASLRSLVLGALSPRLGLTARGAAPPDDYAAATSSASFLRA